MVARLVANMVALSVVSWVVTKALKGVGKKVERMVSLKDVHMVEHWVVTMVAKMVVLMAVNWAAMMVAKLVEKWVA